MIPILCYYQNGQNCICDMQCHIYLSHTTTLKLAQKMLQDNVTYSCHTPHHWNKLKKCFKMVSILILWHVGSHTAVTHSTIEKSPKNAKNDAHINFVTCDVTYSCHMVYLYSKNTTKQLKHIANQSLSLLHKSCLKSTGIHGSPLECLGISGIQLESVGECDILCWPTSHDLILCPPTIQLCLLQPAAAFHSLPCPPALSCTLLHSLILHHSPAMWYCVMIQLSHSASLSNTFPCLHKQTMECLKDAACNGHVMVGRSRTE